MAMKKNTNRSEKVLIFFTFQLFVLKGGSTIVSHHPEKGLLRHILQISRSQCITECNNSQKCISAKYIRLSAMCTLYSEDYGGLPDQGISIYTKRPSETGQIRGQCALVNCEIKDQPESCGTPKQIPATEILGNMVNIGSKIKYNCLDGSGSEVSKCLSDGNWTQVSLLCNCSEPFITKEKPFEETIISWTYQRESSKTILAKPKCTEECNQTSAICNIRTGHWFFTSDICCKKLGICEFSFYFIFYYIFFSF